MRKTITLWLIAAGLLLSVSAFANAQDSSTTQQTTTTTSATSDSKSPADDVHAIVRTLTGCLQKGEDTNEYQFVGQDGSTWELKSESVDLASHVGHTVMITGAVAHPTMHGMKEDARKEAQEHGIDKSATEHGNLTVTDLKMVSSRCAK